MKVSKTSNSYKQIYSLLERYGFLHQMLLPESIGVFQDVIGSIFKKITTKTQLKGDRKALILKFQQTLTVLKETHQQVTLSYIIKKIALLHVFINKSIKLLYYNEQIQVTIKQQINFILQEDLKKVITPEKKASSLNKIYDYIRQLSGSKDSKRKGNSKLKIQNHSEKSAVKQIATKIIEPYCIYLLKILQDAQVYQDIQSSTKFEDFHFVLWKLINWSRSLGSIILELNRLGRYFRQDLTGIWVFIAYIISFDLSIYYDRLKGHMEQQCYNWKQKIQKNWLNNKKDNLQSFQALSQIMNHPRFIQLKRYIQQASYIRERMNYLYINKELRNWKRFFAKSIFYKLDATKKSDHFTFILDFIDKNDINISKLNIHRKISLEESEVINNLQDKISKLEAHEDQVNTNSSSCKKVDFEEQNQHEEVISYSMEGTQPTSAIFKKYFLQPRKASFMAQTRTKFIQIK